ncbi:MAG: TIR domain-containing protein [Anaerolineae bacterium]|jgi:hypothetical protein|nr:TIR domain-containing protein [Anaerolineae bacterium]MBT7990077.1 TIR domain-containing protein [Anaerolineae bacterium]
MQKHTIQVLDQNHIPIGAAFLVADDVLLTCAHVVRAAGNAAGQAVSLRTPSGTELSATVEAWRDENAEDVASLRLAAPLTEMQPLPLGASSGSKGHHFSTYGFPQPKQALSGSGTITGYATLNGIQYLQLESSQVTPGFSGAPVFDEVTKRVVGMVVAIAPPDEYQRQGTTAFAVPAEALREVCGLALSDLCPYRSLDAFTEADAELFFGRERVVNKLLESLKRNPRFLAVLGPSGSGKSSVVQAGLIPALRKGQLSGSEKWGILGIRPGTQPFEQLTSAGMSDPLHLVQAASDWLSAHPQNERLLILIDQFEELLVSTPSDTRAKFVAALADLLDSPLPVTVLLTLRDDFYNRFTQEAGDLVDWVEVALINIPPTLEEAELREIITRPARDLGLVFEPGLVDAILADARTADPSGRAIRSTVLPLLEFALTQLWERREGGKLWHEFYRAMGGIAGGPSQWADRAYYALDEGQRAIARRVFSELVTLGDETQGIADTRRVRNIAELTAKDGEATKTVLDALVDARLLVARHDESSGQDTVEIIHETLLREWGLLEGWLQNDRQFLFWREGLRESQQAWMESGQDEGALLRGVPLAEAEGWLEKRRDDFRDVEKEYITRSIALRKRSEQYRRGVIVGLGFGVFIIMGLIFWRSSNLNTSSLIALLIISNIVFVVFGFIAYVRKDMAKGMKNKNISSGSKPRKKLRVFLCHASKDKPQVVKTFHRLRSKGWIDPWLDVEKILPGTDWDLEIKSAVKLSHVVIVFLSKHSISKEGYVQKEIVQALNIADEKPEGTIFIIPIRLEECTVPNRLERWQWVNLYEKNAYDKLLLSLEKRAQDLQLISSRDD